MRTRRACGRTREPGSTYLRGSGVGMSGHISETPFRLLALPIGAMSFSQRRTAPLAAVGDSHKRSGFVAAPPLGLRDEGVAAPAATPGVPRALAASAMSDSMRRTTSRADVGEPGSVPFVLSRRAGTVVAAAGRSLSEGFPAFATGPESCSADGVCGSVAGLVVFALRFEVSMTAPGVSMASILASPAAASSADRLAGGWAGFSEAWGAGFPGSGFVVACCGAADAGTDTKPASTAPRHARRRFRTANIMANPYRCDSA
jgi:hypothetical protein